MPNDTPAERNKTPIKSILNSILPETGSVLEIASGNGTHVVFFAEHFPNLAWQPSDPDPRARESANEKIRASGLQNVRKPLNLDVQANLWPETSFAALICINMVHISPWESTIALFKRAGSTLVRGSPLFLYGPYIQPEIPTAPTNLAFDESLKQRNPLWGLRNVHEMSLEAAKYGFLLENVIEMPTNNLSIVFRLS